MLLIGVAFLIKGIPGAGLLALAILLLRHHAVAGHADHGAGDRHRPHTRRFTTVASIVFAIYTFVAGLADNVLKPLLLGRGLDVPMPVVLIRAIGGMVSVGIIGLL
jgi:hypothetical protein